MHMTKNEQTHPKEDEMNIRTALDAQLKYTAAITQSAAENGYSDDGYDDLKAALDVCSILATIDLETGQGVNDDAFLQYMTTPLNLDDPLPEPLNLYSDHVIAVYWGTDGIAPEIVRAFDNFHPLD
jgi:hypothetical protein